MLIYIDLETSGLESDDVICSVAVLHKDKGLYALVNEGKKISPSASAVHHITNEMIASEKSFVQSSVCAFLEQYNKAENTLIMHNTKLYLQKLISAGFVWQGDVIDTCKVTKHLIPECELFSLDVLYYELKLYKKEDSLKKAFGIKDALCSKKALYDVLMVQLLFDYLLDYATVDVMKELTCKNVLLQKFLFGKYEGKYIEEIVLNDRAYVEWMLHLSDLDEDLKYSLEYYTKG